MFSRSCLSLIFLCLALLLPAAEVFDFVPTDARQVFRIDLSAPLPGLNDVRDDLLKTAARQTGFDEKGDKTMKIKQLLSEIVIVTPNLTEDFSFILVKTKVTEKEFCSELEKLTGVSMNSVKDAKTSEYRIPFENSGPGSLVARKKRIFVLFFLSENIAVLAKDSLDRFRAFKKLGMPPKYRQFLLIPKTLATGYVKMDPAFLMENPLIPPFGFAVCSLAEGPGASLHVKIGFLAEDKDAAKQLQKYMQQMVMVGAMMLNQIDETLMQDWVTSVRVKRDHDTVDINAFFTRDFIDRLARQADNQFREPPAPAPPENK